MIKRFYPLLLLFFVSHIFGKNTELAIQTNILQTERFCYVSGDLVLLKMVYLQPEINRDLKESVLYVDIVDRDSQFITGEIFKLDQGIASGFLRIPDTVKTGYYLIRAYTHKSKNSSGQEVLDSKQLFVTNRFNSIIEKYEGDYSPSWVNNDSIYLREALNEAYLLNFADTIARKRSKVTGTIQVTHENFNDTAWLALSVKPVSTCESQLASLNEQVVKNESVQDKSIQQDYTVVENTGRIVSGYVTGRATGIPLSNFLVKMAFNDSLQEIKYCNTNEKGEFKFLLTDSYEKQEIYLSVHSYPNLLIYPHAKITIQQDYPEVENKGMIITGHAIDEITGNPLSNLLVLMAFEDSVINLKQSITNEEGEFKFLLTDCYEVKEVYLSAYSYPQLINNPRASLTIESKFLDKVRPLSEPKNIIRYEKSIDTLNVQKSIISIAYELSLMDKLEKSKTRNMSFEHQFLAGNITNTVLIDDYIKLPDFIQIAKEILPFVRLVEENNTYNLSIPWGDVVRNSPIVFVDGVPLTEIDAILNWGSDKIKMVQVQCEPRYYGDVPFENGMIFIWTKKMDFWSKTELKTTPVFTIPCFQKPMKVTFPDYSKENSTIRPDFRKILYWEPSIIIKDNEAVNFDFYTSDEVGVFEVLLQGITNSKQPLVIRKYIQVK